MLAGFISFVSFTWVALIWIMILPFAILALPYTAITKYLKIKDNGYKTLLSFFNVKSFFNKGQQ